ncbi:MAG: single-stranded-DNA-specific exonuclease RecJ, partial [Candidatus Buchananbacteria bacterium]|nr:single-stranded-DNA-specific exonuclease RecJ [Candidatus Buchananbacteria bacterium]
DYDADGVCSSTVLHSSFKALGINVDIYIPSRESEGYGLNLEAVKGIVQQGFKLVVTVDCGISNLEEIAYLREHGVDVIILDHHKEPAQLPNANAIINPSVTGNGYPFAKLCGAGVAFKFIQAVMQYQETHDLPLKLPAGYDKWLLDIVAIATVGDIMPLIGENRAFVKWGLVVLEKTRRPGLRALVNSVLQQSRNKLDSQCISWRIVPRLNAAGRINHATVAFNLLNAEVQSEAEKYCEYLEANNKERQQMTERMLKEGLEQVTDLTDETKFLCVVGDTWIAGVVGLVAGRLADRYHRPTLAVSKQGDKFVGSGRSIPDFDITAALQQCAEFLDHFGGHPQACGFTVIGEENFKNFQQRMLAIANEQLREVKLIPTIKIDAEVQLAEINLKLWDQITDFEPFGEGNPRPLFAAYNLVIEKAQAIGNDGKHLRAMVTQKNMPQVHKLIGFSFGEWALELKRGDQIDIIFEIGVSEWQGRSELELKIVDLRRCASDATVT